MEKDEALKQRVCRWRRFAKKSWIFIVIIIRVRVIFVWTTSCPQPISDHENGSWNSLWWRHCSQFVLWVRSQAMSSLPSANISPPNTACDMFDEAMTMLSVHVEDKYLAHCLYLTFTLQGFIEFFSRASLRLQPQLLNEPRRKPVCHYNATWYTHYSSCRHRIGSQSPIRRRQRQLQWGVIKSRKRRCSFRFSRIRKTYLSK